MAHPLLSRQLGGPPPPPRSPKYLAENLASRLLAIEGALFALSMGAILMRFYVRVFVLKMFGWDDWMMVISACLSTICLGLFVHVVGMGLGRHAEAFPPENIFPFFKVMYFYSISIIYAYSFIKLSIGFFLLRLADRTKWRPILIGMLVFIGLFTIGSTFAIIFQCTPVAAGYDFTLRPPMGAAKCFDSKTFKNIGVFNSSINIATDLLFALIPIPMVWKLQVNLPTRIGLAIILSLGLFASGVAIYKTPLQYNFFRELDFSGTGSWYYIWQQVEMHIGILAACLPTLRPLFASFFGHVCTITRGRTTGSNGISTPFNSSGYVKHSEGNAGNSFPMKNIRKGSQSAARSPYDEEMILDKETYITMTNGGRRTRRCSQVGDSDEGILSHEHRRLEGLTRGMGIIRTTEVSVTQRSITLPGSFESKCGALAG
ncbi:hypothetical protein BDU57DRAFT_440645 [Ampelomyces quisqualis]|uniref:Rhodopsin domain-containing protein n=1 Tax=Ampelomyces quisqualis TaxID=50730 RepID=A0A6A5QY83_AMPQU|nr:hypothetical protein BDU57DRAFT_440645 [Ampelomyces quisqualis]